MKNKTAKKELPRYYWMKLNDTFFDKPEIKKLRKLPGGDKLLVIYLRLMLLVINNGGIYEFKGIENDIFDELSLILNEDRNDIEIVFNYLCARGLVETNYGKNENLYLFSDVVNRIGSETQDAIRKREGKLKEIKKRKISGKIPEKIRTIPNSSGNIPLEIELHQELEEKKEQELEPTIEQTTNNSELKNVEINRDNIYYFLTDDQNQALNTLNIMRAKNEINATKDSLLDYFIKLYKNDWKDGKGKQIKDIVKYVRSNFIYKSLEDKSGGNNYGMY